MAAWHDDDAFWKALAPFLLDQRRRGVSSEQVTQIVRLLEVEPGAQVLDLCCGPGVHSLELARRGFRVTGVDRTVFYLERAQRQATEEGLEIEFVREDMRAFRRSGAFGGAINMLTSFGYFEDPADNLLVLRNLHESLKPGGRALVDVMGKEVVARVFRERDWTPLENGGLLLEERKIHGGWDFMENHWIMIRGAGRKEFTTKHRQYSGTELTLLLQEAGFDPVDLYGSLDGRPYDQAAERLVAVARKPQ